MAIITKTTLCFVFIFAMFGSSLCKSKLDLQQVQEKLQNVVEGVLTSAVSNRISNHVNHLQNPTFPLLPLLPGYPYPAEVCYNPTTLKMNVLDLENLKVDLSIEFNTNMVTKGLDKLSDLFSFKTLPSGVVDVFWKLDLSLLEMMADYNLNLDIIDKTDSQNDITFHINSSNAALISENYFISLFAEAKLFPLWNKLSLSQLNWDTNFPNISWGADWLLETIAANGTHTIIDEGWGDIGQIVEVLLTSIWDNLAYTDLHCLINHVISDCSFAQLVNDEFDCLKMDFGDANCTNGISMGFMSMMTAPMELIPCNSQTEPTETTTTPTETTAPPTETTTPPTETTAPPTETTAPPTETTAPLTETTAPPTETTAPPTETTAPPTETTAPPTETTAPPGSSSSTTPFTTTEPQTTPTQTPPSATPTQTTTPTLPTTTTTQTPNGAINLGNLGIITILSIAYFVKFGL